MYDGPYKFQVTPHFWLYEFIVSHSRPDLAEKIRFNELDGIKVQYICCLLLEPIRLYFNQPKYLTNTPPGQENILKITNGKCSPELNAAIPGRKEDSEHLWVGPQCVVDFVIPRVDLTEVYVFTKARLPNNYGQLILYPDRHIHIGLPHHKHYEGQAWEAAG
jgi:hypothetical protein